MIRTGGHRTVKHKRRTWLLQSYHHIVDFILIGAQSQASLARQLFGSVKYILHLHESVTSLCIAALAPALLTCFGIMFKQVASVAEMNRASTTMRGHHRKLGRSPHFSCIRKEER